MTDNPPDASESDLAFDPSAFLRARRPHLFSDSEHDDKVVLAKEVFEYHLNTLTSRKQEYEFEHFARKLVEKEICPNLIPQTGPTGGGDGKVDSETYAVSKDVSRRWYHAEALVAANERWAFAFSAKADWRSKVTDDVKKITETGRSYSRIYFVTNQFVKSNKRSEVEDKLSSLHGVAVTILDRTWIVEKVYDNDRLQLAVDTLAISSAQKLTSKKLGKLDAVREKELEELEQQIADVDRYKYTSYQLAEDCLQAALLARGLGRPRPQIDALFERAERIGQEVGHPTQRLRIAYDRAWTAYWWYKDFKSLSNHYETVESIALLVPDDEHIERLYTLHTILSTSARTGELSEDESNFESRTAALREELEMRAGDQNRPNASLSARTNLVLMETQDHFHDRAAMDRSFHQLQEILGKSRGLTNYPLDATIEIILDLGKYFTDSDAYDALFETIIELKKERASSVETGRTLLNRGFQKLEGKKNYEAIQLLGRSQIFLAVKENRSEFAQALAGCGLAYEAVGLNWAARANLLAALGQGFSEFKHSGSFPGATVHFATRLVTTELRLGRVPSILEWIEISDIIANHLFIDDAAMKPFRENRDHHDTLLSILLLRTDFWDLKWLAFLPAILDKRGLYASWAALVYALGHEEPIFREFNPGCETSAELKEFFVKLLNQPARKELPAKPEFLRESSLTFRTNLMGCKVTVKLPNKRYSIYLAETLLAALEALFATCVLTDVNPIRPELNILIKDKRISSSIDSSFEIVDDEEWLIIHHSGERMAEYFTDSVTVSTWLQEVLIEIGARIFRIPDVKKWTKTLLVEELGFERALTFSQVAISLENILGNDFRLGIDDFQDDNGSEVYQLAREAPWHEGVSFEKPKRSSRVSDPGVFVEGGPHHHFDPTQLKHSDFRLESIVDVELWDKAQWSGMTFLFRQSSPVFPYLGFGFRDIDGGKTIFRRWKKKFGDWDVDEQIQVTILTGVDKKAPASYRVMVSFDPKLSDDEGDEKFAYFISRNNRMDPPDTKNLDYFMELLEAHPEYAILPARYIDENHRPDNIDLSLAIHKSKIIVKPAWQVDPNSLEVMALRPEHDDLIVPEGKNIDALLERLSKIKSS